MKGQVLKCENGRYSVYADNNKYDCVARGALKSCRQSILTGDYVIFENNCIEKVIERKNHLLRPNVANIDQIAVVLASEPKPDYVMIDKLIINANVLSIPAFIIVNKIDLDENTYQYVFQNYSDVVDDIIDVSAKRGVNLDKLTERLKGKFTVFAGQSAVGKTSIINALFGTDNKTGGLSNKTLRGKHTTTYSEVYFNSQYKVIDSPGFAVLNANATERSLMLYYKEFERYLGKCKYRSCTHNTEPGCAIKNALLNGSISEDRYNRYLTIYNELLKEKRFNEKN